MRACLRGPVVRQPMSESLIAALKRASHAIMTHLSDNLFNICDRARLRERFFGATRTVLARL